MVIVLKYKEWLLKQHPREAVWVYDLATELPVWDERTHEYVFKKKPKRIDAKYAKQVIKEYGLTCVYSDGDGMIYK